MKANEAGVKHEDLMEYFVMRMERIIFMKAVQVINFWKHSNLNKSLCHSMILIF